MDRLFSKALYKENLKRFWSLAALAFVVYYFSSIYILQLRGGRTYNYHTINEMLLNQNIGFIFVECMLPVFLAATLFSYLNKANSVNFMHALPLNRREMFITNYISGITLFFIPQLIIAILLFIYKSPVYYSDYNGNIVGNDIFTTVAVLKWLLLALTVSLFVFSVCLIAASICGNTVISVLTGMGLNVVVPIVYLCIHCYAYNSYFGYANDNLVEYVLEKFHPAVALLANPEAVNTLVWIAISLVLTVCAYLLYQFRKLERCSDSYVYTLAKDIFGFLFVFILSTTANEIFDGEPKYMSSIIGGVVGFLLGQMITRKTFRIFDLKGLKNFVIYALIMVLIVAGISLDITGYQKRIPDERNVEAAYVTCSELFPLSVNTYGTALFEEEDNIKDVIAVHQEIIDHKDELEVDGDYYYSNFSVKYYLKNGQVLNRDYFINRAFLESSENLNKLRNCNELMNSRIAITELDLNDLEIELDIYDGLLQNGLGEFEINFDSDDKIVSISMDEYPSDGQTLSDFLAQKGYNITIDKKEYWDAFCADLLAKDIKIDEDQHQIGCVKISFDKSGLSNDEASRYANRFYYGANYYCKSENSGTYEFTIYIELVSSMSHTINWINENIK